MTARHAASAVRGPSRAAICGPIGALDIEIEPDLSNAAPFLMLAVASGGAITVADWPRGTTQPGDALRDILTRALEAAGALRLDPIARMPPGIADRARRPALRLAGPGFRRCRVAA